MQAVFRATVRPSSCVFEGQYAPRSPDPRTNDETPFPQQRFNAARGPKQRGEHQPSKPLAWRDKLSRPLSPASTPRFDVTPEQRSWSRNMPLVAFNARTIRPVGLHPAAQMRRVHSVEKRSSRSDSNSCLLPRGATRPTEPVTLPLACKQ